ncbi:MAG: hypothetical protein WC865_13875 [Bacteroidales bacterium]
MKKKIELVNDVEQRLCSFPVEWLENVNWLNSPIETAIPFVRN